MYTKWLPQYKISIACTLLEDLKTTFIGFACFWFCVYLENIVFYLNKDGRL